jgi:small subunit ribosomal protein S17
MADENVNETEETEATPEEAPAEETVAEAAEDTVAEAPADAEPAEAEPPSAETDAEVPAAEAVADEAAAATGEPAAAPAAQSGPKPKRKRLPRSERRVRVKPKREAPAERKPIVRLEKPEHERGRRQERQGTVVSDGMEKTIVVRVDVVKAHPKYKKVVRRSVKFHAHDEQSQAKVGDVVRIVETRPLSKTKRWRLAEVVEAAK